MKFGEYQLFEGKEDLIANRQGKSLVNMANSRDEGDRIADWPERGSEWSPEDIEKWGLWIVKEIKKADVQNKYLQWLVNMYLAEAYLLEDIPRVHRAVQGWHQVKPKMQNKDIGQFKHIADLEDAVEEQQSSGELSKKQRQKLTTAVPVRKQDYENVIVHGKDGVLLQSKTQEDNDYYAEGTQWCTRTGYGRPQFDYYVNQGPLYIFLGADGRRYQLHFESKQFMNEQDRRQDINDLRSKYPTLDKFFAWRGENAANDPDLAYSYAMNDLNRQRFPEGEAAIATSAMASSRYAQNIINGPWPEGEPAMLKEPNIAIDYLLKTRKTPWPEAEQYFKEDAEASYKYASEIMKGAWPPGEAKIAQDPELAFKYARLLGDGRWPQGEAAMATDAATAFNYAVDVLGRKRFPQGEAAILNDVDKDGNVNADVAINYAERVLRGRWKEAEPRIALDDWSTIWYINNVYPEFDPSQYTDNVAEPA